MYYIALVDQTIVVAWLFWYMVGIELGGRLFLAVYWSWRGWNYDYYSNRWGKIKFAWQAWFLGILFLSYFWELNYLGLTWELVSNIIVCCINIFATISLAVHLHAPRRNSAIF